MIFGMAYSSIDQPFIAISAQTVLDESDIEAQCGRKILYFYTAYSTRHDKAPRIKMDTKPIKRSNPRAGVFIHRDNGITIMDGNDYSRLKSFETVGKAFYDYYYWVFDYAFRNSSDLNATEVVDLIRADIPKRIKTDISELIGREPLLYIPGTKAIVSNDEIKEMERLKEKEYWERKNLEYSGLL